MISARISINNVLILASIGHRLSECMDRFWISYHRHTRIILFIVGYIVHGVSTACSLKLFTSWTTLSSYQYLSILASLLSYFGTLCGSTIMQAYLLHHGTSKTIAFWSVIALGSIVNYVVLTSLNEVREHRDTTHRQNKMATVASKIWKSRNGNNI